MWDEVARRVRQLGGGIHLKHRLVGIEREGFRVTAIRVRDEATGAIRLVPCDYLISTVPVRDLLGFLKAADPRSHESLERCRIVTS